MGPQRYLIGFQQTGMQLAKVHDVFEDNFGEIEDCDVVLIDDPSVTERRRSSTTGVNSSAT